jgi:hypothetical protein
MVGYIVYTNTRSRAVCDMYYNSLSVLELGPTVHYLQPPTMDVSLGGVKVKGSQVY